MRTTHLLWTRRPRSVRGRRVTSVAPGRSDPGGPRTVPGGCGPALIAATGPVDGPGTDADRKERGRSVPRHRVAGMAEPHRPDPHRLLVGAHVEPTDPISAAAERSA